VEEFSCADVIHADEPPVAPDGERSAVGAERNGVLIRVRVGLESRDARAVGEVPDLGAANVGFGDGGECPVRAEGEVAGVGAAEAAQAGTGACVPEPHTRHVAGGSCA
jgi:hypothetical protein